MIVARQFTAWDADETDPSLMGPVGLCRVLGLFFVWNRKEIRRAVGGFKIGVIWSEKTLCLEGLFFFRPTCGG